MNKRWLCSTPVLWGSGKSHLSFIVSVTTNDFVGDAQCHPFKLLKLYFRWRRWDIAWKQESTTVDVDFFKKLYFITNTSTAVLYIITAFFSIPTPISLHSPPPPDCILPFVSDFGTIPLQITFPQGKEALTFSTALPTLSFFYIPIPLCLSASGAANRLIQSGSFYCFSN